MLVTENGILDIGDGGHGSHWLNFGENMKKDKACISTLTCTRRPPSAFCVTARGYSRSFDPSTGAVASAMFLRLQWLIIFHLAPSAATAARRRDDGSPCSSRPGIPRNISGRRTVGLESAVCLSPTDWPARVHRERWSTRVHRERRCLLPRRLGPEMYHPSKGW